MLPEFESDQFRPVDNDPTVERLEALLGPAYRKPENDLTDPTIRRLAVLFGEVEEDEEGHALHTPAASESDRIEDPSAGNASPLDEVPLVSPGMDSAIGWKPVNPALATPLNGPGAVYIPGGI